MFVERVSGQRAAVDGGSWEPAGREHPWPWSARPCRVGPGHGGRHPPLQNLLFGERRQLDTCTLPNAGVLGQRLEDGALSGWPFHARRPPRLGSGAIYWRLLWRSRVSRAVGRRRRLPRHAAVARGTADRGGARVRRDGEGARKRADVPGRLAPRDGVREGPGRLCARRQSLRRRKALFRPSGIGLVRTTHT